MGLTHPTASTSMIDRLKQLIATDPQYPIQAINTLLELAASSGASDGHLQPLATQLSVSLRVDGVLQPTIQLPLG